MTNVEFLNILSEEVKTYKDLSETRDKEWIIKGFVDIDKNIYTITNDTKMISKIIEIILIPQLALFAKRNGLRLELPSKQNFYPDLTFVDDEGNLFAVDFKSSYYEDGKVNGLTLGSYWGYFRQRNLRKSTDHPYEQYKCHLVIGILYKQMATLPNAKAVYSIDELEAIRSVIGDFIFFVQPKWKIATDTPGSGNTRNIGGETDIAKLINGEGAFAKYGEDIFDDYWMNYYNAADAERMGMGKPHYTNLKTYKEYIRDQGRRSKIFDGDE